MWRQLKRKGQGLTFAMSGELALRLKSCMLLRNIGKMNFISWRGDFRKTTTQRQLTWKENPPYAKVCSRISWVESKEASEHLLLTDQKQFERLAEAERPTPFLGDKKKKAKVERASVRAGRPANCLNLSGAVSGFNLRLLGGHQGPW